MVLYTVASCSFFFYSHDVSASSGLICECSVIRIEKKNAYGATMGDTFQLSRDVIRQNHSLKKNKLKSSGNVWGFSGRVFLYTTYSQQKNLH